MRMRRLGLLQQLVRQSWRSRQDCFGLRKDGCLRYFKQNNRRTAFGLHGVYTCIGPDWSAMNSSDFEPRTKLSIWKVLMGAKRPGWIPVSIPHRFRTSVWPQRYRARYDTRSTSTRQIRTPFQVAPLPKKRQWTSTNYAHRIFAERDFRVIGWWSRLRLSLGSDSQRQTHRIVYGMKKRQIVKLKRLPSSSSFAIN
jgi:hypothetical protein